MKKKIKAGPWAGPANKAIGNGQPRSQGNSSTSTPPPVNAISGPTITITLPPDLNAFLEGVCEFGPGQSISLEEAAIRLLQIGMCWVEEIAEAEKSDKLRNDRLN